MNVNQTTQESLDIRQGRRAPAAEQDTRDAHRAPAAAPAARRGPRTSPPRPEHAGGKSNYKHETTNSTLGVNKTVTHSTIAPGHRRKPARLGAARPLACPPPRSRRSSEAVTNAAGHPDQARRHDLDRPGRVREDHHRSRGVQPSSTLAYAKYALLGIGGARLPVLHHPLAAQARDARRSRSPSGCASSTRRCGSPSSNAKRASGRRAGDGRRRRQRQRQRQRATGTATAAPAASDPLRRQVEQLADSDPDVVAQQLRNWMQEG